MLKRLEWLPSHLDCDPFSSSRRATRKARPVVELVERQPLRRLDRVGGRGSITRALGKGSRGAGVFWGGRKGKVEEGLWGGWVAGMSVGMGMGGEGLGGGGHEGVRAGHGARPTVNINEAPS